VGKRVNLERAVQVGGRIDGHIVQGHVDSTGYLVQSVKEGEYRMMEFSIHKDVYALTISQGSIAINGVSLTIGKLRQDCVCQIGVIPFTFQHTNLGDLERGDRVNVEGDLIGKYVSKILSKRGE
jgi:riboflavin synthase